MNRQELIDKLKSLPAGLRDKCLSLPQNHRGEDEFTEEEKNVLRGIFGTNWKRELGL